VKVARLVFSEKAYQQLDPKQQNEGQILAKETKDKSDV
jgi:hypothetical protein